jgi:drug/metabolite transporter (DMT)-like permease
MLKLTLTTAFALIAFAANSVLGRLALAQGDIDPGNFTLLRLLSGAISLAIISVVIQRRSVPKVIFSGGWMPAIALLMYAATFSYAYVSLDTATGALILFTAVQLTMLLVSYFKGQRFQALEWVGMSLAFAGFLILIVPNLNHGSTVIGIALMTVSGVAWGWYTLLGQGAKYPTLISTGNFIRAALLALPLVIVSDSFSTISSLGIIYAVCSGAFASAIGYAVWYSVLPELSTSQAAVSQLIVPALAALGGVLFAGDSLSLVLVTSLIIIIAGIVLVIYSKANQP